MGGLIKTMPVTAVAFLFCAFSVMGIPPFGGFFTKYMVIIGTVQAGQVWVAALALFTAVLTMFYLFRVFSAGLPGRGQASGPARGPRSMVFVRRLLAVLSLAGRPLRRLSDEAGQRRDGADAVGGSDDARNAAAPDPPAGRRWPSSCSSLPRRRQARSARSLAVARRGRAPLCRPSPSSAAKDLRFTVPWLGHRHRLRPAPLPLQRLHPAGPGRLPLPDRPLLDGQDEGQRPGSASSTPTSS